MFMLSVGCLSLVCLLVMLGDSLRHPVIVELRISEFNVETNMVTFWFVDENGVKQFITLSALEFIGRLVSLIPDKNFKLIRYYGLYSRRTSGRLQKVLTCLSREKVPARFKGVVVCCSNCGKSMDFLGVTRLDGDGGLVYDAWSGGDDDCW